MFWIGAILAISLLIVVHEAGHYFVARWCGMRVERFSIGFGPAIAGWRSKRTGTFFQIAPIPFGGFVEIKGMNIVEEVDPDDVTAYPNRPAWQRFVTILAGPATNYLAAIVLALVLFSTAGIESTESWYGVDEVSAGYDAEHKLEPDDRILAVGGRKVWLNSPDNEEISLSAAVQAKQQNIDPNHLPAQGAAGLPVIVTIERDGKTQDVTITPKFDRGDPAKKVAPGYRLGIVFRHQYDHVHVGPFGVVKAAIVYPIQKTEEIAVGLYLFATGQVEGRVEGPVGMTTLIRQAFAAGWVTALQLVMMLNVYLGLFNLLPLPALDGGRLAFLGYEMATRRRPNPRVEATIHMVGILIIAVIMVLVTFRDCARL